MCTLTLLPPSGSCVTRVVVNRDELVTRAEALPPARGGHPFGGRRALLPIDPESGGTWVGVNDAGVVLALLNLNLPGGGARQVAALNGGGERWERKGGGVLASRGGIIPGLLHCGSADDAVDVVHGHRAGGAGATRPFTLVIADGRHVATVRCDGVSVGVEQMNRPVRPVMWTSSGLGDHVVEGPRRALFDGWFGGGCGGASGGASGGGGGSLSGGGGGGDAAAWVERQEAFHRHRWDGRPQWSVMMNRDGARTVSTTTVYVGRDRVAMRYRAVDPQDTPTRELEAVVVHLDRRDARVSGARA